MPLCIAAGGAVTALALSAFTLSWTHSIEKIRWEEDYVVEGQALRLVEARVRGHGAGMEPPEGSWLAQGVWHYRPALPPLPALRLANSRFTAGYEFCKQGHCRPLAAVAPAAAADTPVVISVCKP
jgi:hypothetical protein